MIELPFEDTNWMRYFLRMMNAPFEDFVSNQVSFITYNYDRSLEHFLFEAVKAG